MYEKVLRLGIKQNKRDFLYYIHKGDVLAKPIIKPGQKHFETVILASTGIEMDDAYMYSLDRDGDIVRIKRTDALPYFFGVGKEPSSGKKPSAKTKKSSTRTPSAKKTARKR